MKTLAALLFGIAALTASGADLPPINSPATPDRFPGKFIWGDLFTSDPAAAQNFYTGLFGWTAVTIERPTWLGTRHYIVLSDGDRPVAGIVTRNARQGDEVHGRWVGFVSVPDVAHALNIAATNGGRVLMPARELAQRGAQAIFADADGAALGLMRSSSGDPGEYLAGPGDWTWAELFARDPGTAGLFYRNVVGYDLIPDSRSGRPGSFILASNGYSRAGVIPVPDRPRAHPAWLLFVRVASVKDSSAKAVSLGGRVLVPASDDPSEYWRAIVADPSGAPIGIVELGDAVTGKQGP